MSYMICRWPVATLMVSLGAGACGGADTDQASFDTTVAASLSQLLEVDDFVDFLDSEPSAVLANVHIPYEGNIDDTDAFAG